MIIEDSRAGKRQSDQKLNVKMKSLTIRGTSLLMAKESKVLRAAT